LAGDVRFCTSSHYCSSYCRLNLSQLVQCSGGVSATSLQSFFPPWQLTQHQQQQVLSVLRRREDGAGDVNGGVVGNGVLEEMCLVGFGRAVNALEHYSAENVSFAEIDAESCTCANGASRVAMAEADITEHIVAVKVGMCALNNDNQSINTLH
jgi:hypothetical protein